jgi:hypothetical protein
MSGVSFAHILLKIISSCRKMVVIHVGQVAADDENTFNGISNESQTACGQVWSFQIAYEREPDKTTKSTEIAADQNCFRFS